MRVGVWMLLFGSVLVTGCAGEPAPPESPFRPVADVGQLMRTIIDPAADVVWDSVGTIVTEEDGEIVTDSWQPESDEERAAVVSGAMMLTESANLLMMDGRARDQDTWMQMSQGMVAAGMLAVEAAESQNVDAIYEVSATVYNSCDSCHQLYWVGDADRGRVQEAGP